MEPDMIRITTGLAILVVTALAWAPTAVADPGAEVPVPIDWRDFVDHEGEGGHVVGEEMCVRPR
jgi:hypothetical protein